MNWNGDVFPIVYCGVFFAVVLLAAIIVGHKLGDD